MELELYNQVKISIKKLFNIDLDHYKDEQMRRRLDSWLVRSGETDWTKYSKRLKVDTKEVGRFRNYLTINVSAFYRDPERWQSLQETVIPRLIKEALKLRPANTGLRLWSAGCSIGAEPYTLAMILDELSPMGRHYLLATDFDRGALEKATAGGPYTEDEIQNLSAAQRSAYVMPGGPPFFIKKSLIKKIDFQEQNMLTNAFQKEIDLIVCRNVVIYFTGETKEALYRKFYDALRQGGVLFVGATEIIPRPQEIGFRSCGISFYQKA